VRYRTGLTGKHVRKLDETTLTHFGVYDEVVSDLTVHIREAEVISEREAKNKVYREYLKEFESEFPDKNELGNFLGNVKSTSMFDAEGIMKLPDEEFSNMMWELYKEYPDKPMYGGVL
jgi:hypothetical protein